MPLWQFLCSLLERFSSSNPSFFPKNLAYEKSKDPQDEDREADTCNEDCSLNVVCGVVKLERTILINRTYIRSVTKARNSVECLDYRRLKEENKVEVSESVEEFIETGTSCPSVLYPDKHLYILYFNIDVNSRQSPNTKYTCTYRFIR